MLPFSETEIERRQAQACDYMAANGMDAVVATSFPNVYYLSGAPLHQFGRPGALILPRDGEATFLISILEGPHVERQSNVRDLRFYCDHNISDSYASPQPPLTSFLELLKTAFHDHGLEDATIAYEDHWLPAAHLEAIKQQLPRLTLVAGSKWMDRHRMVLSEEEQALVRAADDIAEAGQLALLSELKPGIKPRELDRVCRDAMDDAAARLYPDKPYVNLARSGLEDDSGKWPGHCDWVYGGETPAAAKGMVLNGVFDCFLWAYWGNVERAVSVGEPQGDVRNALEAVVEANEAAIKAVRPGVSVASVDAAAKEVLTDRGYGNTGFGSGCGRGIVSHENWARFLPLDVRLYNEVILEPGMAVSIEPMIGDARKYPYRHCNTVFVTRDGCEVHSQVDRGVLWVEA